MATFDHGYAVVIGVDDNNIAKLALPTVAKDVQAIYDVLVHPERCAYKPENVKLLKGSESTQKNILDAFFWLQEQVAADPQATAVVYYSGHGMRDKASEEYYLIPYDIRGLSRVRADALKAEAVSAEISAINAPRMLVLLDCCHADGMDIKDVDLEALEKNIDFSAEAFPIDLPAKDVPEFDGEPGISKDVSDLLEGNGRAVLNSSTNVQSSYVRRDRTLSLFTYHLIEALTGYAPHPDDATVVYVTDVMSWVTHEVKKSAKSEGVEQTPVMRTTGVFPVAQLIGGQGVAKGLGEAPPDPLAPLPATGPVTTFNQEGQTVDRQINAGTITGGINMGDTIHGDQVGGDQISVGDISGSSGVAIGRGASARVTSNQFTAGDVNISALFAPLQTAVAQADPAMSGKVNALKAEVEKGNDADDNTMASLVTDLADGAPSVKALLADLFKSPVLTAIVGPITQFALSRLG